MRELTLIGDQKVVRCDSVRANIPAAREMARTGNLNPRSVTADVLGQEELPGALPELRTKPVFTRK